MDRILNSILVFAWCVLFAYISLVPFYYFQTVTLDISWQSFRMLKYFPMVIILGIFFLSFRNLKFVEFTDAISFSTLIYVLINAVSLWNAKYLLIGGSKLAYFFVTGILLLFLLKATLHKDRALYRLICSIVATASVVALYGILVYLTRKDIIWGGIPAIHNPYHSGIDRVGSTLGNAVFCGAYLALCSPLSWWGIEHARTDKHRWAFGFASLLIFIGLGMTLTRGAWGALGVAAGIYWLRRRGEIWLWMKENAKNGIMIACFIVFLMCIPLFEGAGVVHPLVRHLVSVVERLHQIIDLPVSEPFRLAQFQTTSNVLCRYPFLGLGFGNFTRRFDEFKAVSTPTGYIATTTENMYLMVLCESGLIGGIVFLCMIVAIVWKFRNCHLSCKRNTERDLALAAMAAVLGFAVNMFTWDALNQPTVRITFWLVVGIGLCARKLEFDRK